LSQNTDKIVQREVQVTYLLLTYVDGTCCVEPGPGRLAGCSRTSDILPNTRSTSAFSGMIIEALLALSKDCAALDTTKSHSTQGYKVSIILLSLLLAQALHLKEQNMGSMGDDVVQQQPPLGLLISEINIFRFVLYNPAVRCVPCDHVGADGQNRAPGDVNNPRTFSFPTIQAMAKDSLLVKLVASKPYDSDFIDNWVRAGEELIAQGAVGIITSCGFLVLAQKE
jgi:hypothetical protein